MSAKRGKLHADIGVIGGSGLYGMEGLDGVREVRPSTPFGRPSDALVLGTV
ncbi:MAG: S-methyl-5'-thioadenosine phosphorylase, partial [Nitrospirota bacterium]|nr:S-methyl-5'-thioadenosine phosphorylase [Nitrospirota bacterium]